MKFELIQYVPTDPDTYWKVFFDEKYNVALYTQAVTVRKRTLLELTENDRSIIRRVQITPDEDVPAAFKKIIGGDTSFIETTTWKKGSDQCGIAVQLTAERLRSRFRFNGGIRITQQSNRIRREFSGELNADVMLLGNRIEKFILSSIANKDAAAESFMAQWIRNL